MTRTIAIPAIPASTPECLIFPITPDNQFDTSFYNPGFTNGRASTEEIIQILTEIQAARQPIVAKFSSAYCSYILSVVFSLFAMIALAFFFVSFIHPFAAFISFFLELMFINILATVFRSNIAKLNEQSKAAAQKVLDNYSGTFASRGLRWVMPMHFPRWMELHKDYLLCQNPGQPIYMPPNMYQQPAPVYLDQGQPQFQSQYQENSYYQNQLPDGAGNV